MSPGPECKNKQQNIHHAHKERYFWSSSQRNGDDGDEKKKEKTLVAAIAPKDKLCPIRKEQPAL